jgi:hypothetical protein
MGPAGNLALAGEAAVRSGLPFPFLAVYSPRGKALALMAAAWNGKVAAVTEQRRRGAVGRQAARAILIDDDGRLVFIRRTKPGHAPYWTAPGGGVEASDESVEAALHRELAEELGAEASGAARVFLFSSPSEAASLSSTFSWPG